MAKPASKTAPAMPPLTASPPAAFVPLAPAEDVVELESLPDPDPDPVEAPEVVDATTAVV